MPLRKCVGCSKIKETSQLIRIMKEHNSREVIINPNSCYFGRSSYVCYNKECVQSAIKKRRLQKTLKTEVHEKTLEEIKILTKN